VRGQVWVGAWLMSAVCAAVPVAAAPLVSPAFQLDPPIWGQGATGTQSKPDLASNGSSYLVAWIQQTDDGARSLVATRVDAVGTPLDPPGIVLGPVGASSDARPYVASDGSGYIVAWENRAARVSASGALLDPGGIDLPAEVDGLAFAGGQYVFHAVGDPIGGQHRLFRMTPAGAILDDPPLQFGPGPGYLELAMAASADTLLVLSVDLTGTTTDNIVAQRFDAATLVPLDPQPLVVGTHDHFTSVDVMPAAVSDGTDFLLVFDGCSYELPTGGSVLAPTCAQSLTGARSVVFDGSGYVAANENTLQRLALDGSVIGNAVPGGGIIATGPAGFMTTYTAVVAAADEVRVTPFDAGLITPVPQGIALLPIQVGVANVQDLPETIATPTGHFVQWKDGRSPAGWYRVRVAADGTVVDAEASLLHDKKVALASSDTEVLALISDGWKSILATKLGATGLLTPGGVPVGDSDLRLHNDWKAVWGGNGYLLDYYSFDPQMALNPDNSSALLDANGIFVAYTTYAPNAYLGEVAFDGSNYLVAWRSEPDGTLEGRQVSPAGVTSPNSIPIAIDAGGNGGMRMATAPGLTLAVFNRSGKIRATRIDDSGAVLDFPPMIVSNVASTQGSPAVAFDGTVFWIAWEDDRDGTQSIFGTRVDTLGNILDGDGLPLANAAERELIPSLSAINGAALLVYARDDGNPDHRRVEARTLSDGGCGVNAECGSGFCVDGVCCDSACGNAAADDCLACSIAAGASADGTCGPIADASVCAGGVCVAGVCEASGAGGSGGSGGGSPSGAGAGGTGGGSPGAGGAQAGAGGGGASGAGASPASTSGSGPSMSAGGGGTPSSTAAGGDGSPSEDDDGCSVAGRVGVAGVPGAWVALAGVALALGARRRTRRTPTSCSTRHVWRGGAGIEDH
jgi:hypothetical protein